MDEIVDPKARNPTYQGINSYYTLPNDSYEQSRLEDQAAGLVEMMHGNVFHAPVINPARVIDVGCGTGIQTCLLGSFFAKAHVYGVELSAVPHRPKPANVEWIQGDIRDLMHNRIEADSVDFIFSRLLILGMTDWQGYINNVVTLLKPGGWVEMQEYDLDWIEHPTGNICSKSWKWLAALREQAKKKGWDLNCGTHMKTYLEKAGLVSVQVMYYRMPYGTWAVKDRPETERIGMHSAREYGPLFHHAIARILDGVESEENIKKLQAESAETLGKHDKKFMPFTVTIGKRPEAKYAKPMLA